MRIITGTAKGMPLVSLDPQTVPLSDRAKSALFAIIQNKIPGSFILDMYAGSGALGIECLSRGASFCQFFDISQKAIMSIQQNLEKTHLSEKAEIVKTNIEKHIEKHIYEQFDIIFVCPPYPAVKFRVVEQAVSFLKPWGILIFEHDKHDHFPQLISASKIDERNYGIVQFEIYQKQIVKDS